MSLDRTLADIYAPQLRWLSGRIDAITGDTVTLAVGGGYIPNVGCSDQYTPVVGDVVHALSWEPNGILVLCSSNQPGAGPVSPLTPGAPSTITPTSFSVYDTATGSWAPGTTVGPTRTGAWFYSPGAFSALADIPMASVEIAITRTAGGPPELVALTNTSALGPPAAVTYTASRYGLANTPIGVSTWLPLPLEWGQGLASGEIGAIGVGGALYSGTYTGTGQIRMTPL
jgi:hypothetical protein